MNEHNDQAVLARRVRLAVAELEGLPVLPSVAVSVCQAMAHSSVDVDILVPLVEVCPELAVLVLSLAHEEGLVAHDCDYRLSVLVRHLPQARLRRSLLALKPCAPFDTSQVGPGAVCLERSDVLLHSMAAAQAAQRIAEMMEVSLSPSLAYLGGLLHDVGKLALLEVMPKGYARMVGAARDGRSTLFAQERAQLGIDHSNMGASLAQHWHLPLSIQRVIRLHHLSETWGAPSGTEFVLTRVVQLANTMAKSRSIGASGCFAPAHPEPNLLAALGLSTDQWETLAAELPALVEPMSQVLQLDMEEPHHRYGSCLHGLVLSLSDSRERQEQERRGFERLEAFQAFVLDLVRSVDSGMDPLDVALSCARQWQRYFQTGKVCLLLYPHPDQPGRSVVLVDALAEGTMMVLDPDLDDLVESPPPGTGVELTRADDWEPLFTEIEASFARERTRALVLRANGQAVGALAFELNQPGDVTHFQDDYQGGAQVVAHLLQLACARLAVEDIVTGLLETNALPASPQEEVKTTDAFDALAEMAAGFAHELNNPLSVISGRAELLAQSETSEQAKLTLRLIQDNARDMAKLVEALLEFAEPPKPHIAPCDLAMIIEEATALAQHKWGEVTHAVEVSCPAPGPRVMVDSAQVASALANVITNAGESYEESGGRIEVTVEAAAGSVHLTVNDRGRGMDPYTRQRALFPFFSALPAGRKRGLGLAYAYRLVALNNGLLTLQSEPGVGTTVTLELPLA